MLKVLLLHFFPVHEHFEGNELWLVKVKVESSELFQGATKAIHKAMRNLVFGSVQRLL